jgi:hypothetical protein
MKKAIALLTFCFLPPGIIIKKSCNNQYATIIKGRWKKGEKGWTPRFNPDGTFILVEESEEAWKASRRERRSNNKSVASNFSGAYIVTATTINMVMVVESNKYGYSKCYL